MYSKKDFNQLKGTFFRSIQEENLRCLEPEELCELPLIRSHSVQDSRILEELAVDQHVYVLKIDFGSFHKMIPETFSEPKIKFSKCSIHNATTFKGLCNIHDTKIFRPIDTEELDLNNTEHIFLLTYRAVLKEMATLISTSRMMQKAYSEKIELGFLKENEPCIEGILPVLQMQKAYEWYEYKKNYDFIYLNKCFDSICFKSLILEQPATFAVSSVFTPLELGTKLSHAKQLERIGVNIFPYNQKTYVIFSCLECDLPYMNNYISDIINSSGDYQKYLLSKVVLRNCENIVFSPTSIEKWTDKKKEDIIGYFTETM